MMKKVYNIVEREFSLLWYISLNIVLFCGEPDLVDAIIMLILKYGA